MIRAITRLNRQHCRRAAEEVEEEKEVVVALAQGQESNLTNNNKLNKKQSNWQIQSLTPHTYSTLNISFTHSLIHSYSLTHLVNIGSLFSRRLSCLDTNAVDPLSIYLSAFYTHCKIDQQANINLSSVKWEQGCHH